MYIYTYIYCYFLHILMYISTYFYIFNTYLQLYQSIRWTLHIFIHIPNYIFLFLHISTYIYLFFTYLPVFIHIPNYVHGLLSFCLFDCQILCVYVCNVLAIQVKNQVTCPACPTCPTWLMLWSIYPGKPQTHMHTVIRDILSNPPIIYTLKETYILLTNYTKQSTSKVRCFCNFQIKYLSEVLFTPLLRCQNTNTNINTQIHLHGYTYKTQALIQTQTKTQTHRYTYKT